MPNEITSWTDYGMDWSNPDSSKLEYAVALYNALIERKAALYTQNAKLSFFEERGAKSECFVRNIIIQTLIHFNFKYDYFIYSYWYHPEILDNLTTSTPNDYLLFQDKYIDPIIQSVGLEDFNIPDVSNKRTMDNFFKFLYEVINLMYIIRGDVVCKNIGKGASSDWWEDPNVAISQCNSRFDSTNWSWYVYTSFVSSYSTRLVYVQGTNKYQFTRSSVPRRMLLKNRFNCKSKIIFVSENVAPDYHIYYHPIGIPQGQQIREIDCDDYFFIGDRDNFLFDPNHYYFGGGNNGYGYSEILKSQIYQRMDVQDGFKFKNW